ncbi:MAG: methyltransferase domain-containing protein [Gemmatimonadaceae bacterium]|nr:methyltransferase domain-containing protein [Gemmatimonadaceae bacterium]
MQRSTDSQPGVGGDVRRAVVQYYDNTWVDYRLAWLNGSNMAIHFGFHDERHRAHGAALENTNRVLADIVGVKAGERILDAGCGIGGSSLWLARNLGAEVVGITLVPSQVRRARLQADRQGLGGQVRFEVADYTDTKLDDASFDVVWALESLCHAPVKEAFYREAVRVLRPGGRLVVAEYFRTRRGMPSADEAVVREWLDGWEIPDIDTRDEHVEAAARAGLVSVGVEDHTDATRPSLRRAHDRARMAHPLLTACHMLGVRNRIQHRNAVAIRRQYQALMRDTWFYAVLTARKPV